MIHKTQSNQTFNKNDKIIIENMILLYNYH